MGLVVVVGSEVSGWTRHAEADTVYLKRGGSIEGEVVEGATTVEIKIDGGSTTFSKDEIERIKKNNNRPAANHPSALTQSKWTSFKNKAANSINKIQRKVAHSTAIMKSKTANGMKPIQKSSATAYKGQALNNSLESMQDSLKAMHKQEKSLAEQKRALKNSD
jgi:hypothetical protein